MHYYEVAPVSTIATNKSTLTYQHELELKVGQLVRMQLGRRTVNGVIHEIVEQPKYTTRPILEILGDQIVPESLIQIATHLSQHYATPLPLVWQTILPTGVHKNRRNKEQKANIDNIKPLPELSQQQKSALKILTNNPAKTSLLKGVTGSGKTLVYIARALQLLKQGESSIVLVPEIGLTAQQIKQFATYLSPIFVTHSRMTESERHATWKQILSCETPCIVVGPRSALFSPIKNLGMIVIDESHEPSYKQDQNPKYSALRAGAMLANIHKAQLILGSATPAIADYYVAEQKSSPIILMDKTHNTVTPAKIEVIDLKQSSNKQRQWITPETKAAVDWALKHKRQTLIFHNRRGSAASSLCDSCGWVSECPTCFLPLTLHADWHQLRCHICDFKTTPPPFCPECKNPDITFKGFGTKQIEADVRSMFPNTKIARYDTDSAKGESLIDQYEELRAGKIDIIIGTQTVAKGLDLPNLDVVIVPLADVGLYVPDFSASERTFQLLHQVAGRVGRHSSNGKVIVQTYTPDHPAITHATSGTYESFYKQELEHRREAKYPPFVFMLKITGEYASAASAKAGLKKYAVELSQQRLGIVILGPAPAFHERFHDRYRWQLVIKSRDRQTLLKIAAKAQTKYIVDIDPSNLL